MTKGYAAPEVAKAYTRAWELCRQIGETPELFRVLRGLRTFYLTRGEFHKARELGEQLLTLAQSQKDPALLLSAYDTLGIILFHLGELAPARAHLEQGIALYDPQKHRSHAFVQDPGVVCLAYMAFILWFLGYPDQALKRIHEALTLAQELSHPHSLAYALGCAAVVHQLCQKVQAAQEQAEAAIALSRGQGFAYWLAMGTILRGWALAGQGEAEEGIAQIRQGLTAWRATGAETMRPYFLALLTEAYEKAGRADEGLNVLAEALDVIYKTGERFYEAELHRLKGELLLAQESKNQKRFPRCGVPTGRFPAGTKGKNEDVSETEECFRQALDIARRQSAKSLELRAVMSLGRLLHRQGKGEEARQLLAEICGWFTEGFDPTDLQEARALLAELL
jgi:predicted ATPase